MNAFIILKDVHESLKDPKVIALIKAIALKNIYSDDYYVTILIVSTKVIIPTELEKFITLIDIPLPRENEIFQIIKQFEIDMEIVIDEQLIDWLTEAYQKSV